MVNNYKYIAKKYIAVGIAAKDCAEKEYENRLRKDSGWLPHLPHSGKGSSSWNLVTIEGSFDLSWLEKSNEPCFEKVIPIFQLS